MTRSFPGADIGSDHDLVMKIFRVHLKKTKKTIHSRLNFDLEKLRNPDVAGTFQQTIGEKFAPLINLKDDNTEIDSMLSTYNTALSDTASELLGNKRRRKKPWLTRDVLDLCDEKMGLKKRRYKEEGAKEFRKAKKLTTGVRRP